MRTGGDFHKDLEKDLRKTKFETLFQKEKSRLRLVERLRQIMTKSHLSIRHVARLMGTSKSQVVRMISDPKANVGVDSLIKFATVFGRRLDIRIK
ncbi:MAG TPA: helix-turn-helix transcriptional regulator [bacterium]|nr:helix-turn-helix transcriptional regulator [bacterium]